MINRPSTIIGTIMVTYGLFWAWYSARRKPLTADEVEAYMAKLSASGRSGPALERVRAFLQADTGRSFVMVNLIKLRAQPEPMPPGGPTTSAAVLERYTSQFLPALLRRAGHPILTGKATGDALEVWGVSEGETWTNVGLVRYRSRRDMIEEVTKADFEASHPYKIAAIEKTIAVPADPWVYAGDPRLLLGLLALIGILAARGPRRGRA